MLFDVRPTARRSLSGRWGAVLLVVLAASIAALTAHIAIDVLGDFVLPHDTYDDIAHGSRTALSCPLPAVLAVAALRWLSAALDESRSPARDKRPPIDPRMPYLHVALVVVTAFVLVGGMEGADLMLAGRPLEDLDDLLGGSIGLCAAVTLPVAMAVACVVWRIACWLTAVQLVAIRMLGAWFVQRASGTAAANADSRRPMRRIARTPVLARSTSKRGPPTAF
jgi:hypothetical protein